VESVRSGLNGQGYRVVVGVSWRTTWSQAQRLALISATSWPRSNTLSRLHGGGRRQPRAEGRRSAVSSFLQASFQRSTA
jgi:hypothetical protein